MSDPGTGGLTPPPLNLPGAQPLVPGIQAGVQQAVVIANVVIVSGPSGAISGVFVYATGTTPGLGNPPIASVTNQTADPFGNTVPQGISFTAGGIQGHLGPAGADLLALVFSQLSSPPSTGPRLGVIQAGAAGCKAEVTSGLSLAGSVAATVGLTDSTSAGGTSDLSLQAGNIDLLATALLSIGASASALWNEAIAQLSLPAGGGPFILNESFHTMGLPAGLTGTVRVKKLPWNKIALDVQVSWTATAATTFTMTTNFPDATYYPTAQKILPMGHNGVEVFTSSHQPARIFVPTSGAMQVIVPATTGGGSGGNSIDYPNN